jgi:type IV pilus assembly protein PilV
MLISNPTSHAASQGGSALIEILVSILIFAMGILGILGLQTTTVGVAADARYRTEAAALADEYIALMVTADPLTLSNYVTGGSAFTAWYNVRVRPTAATLVPVALPNADFEVDVINPVANTPVAINAAAGNTVRVTVNWRASSEKTTDEHTHVTRTTIPPPRPPESL